MRKFGLIALCALAWVAVAAGAAGAHVTVSPSSLPQGTDDAILTFRVPNESATASVTGLKIQFPLSHPIVLLNPESGSGWQVNVVKTALPKPVTTDDGTFTSTVSEIDWSGSTIAVGQFGEFNVLAQGIPKGTSQLVFKAIQTYSDGTVVSWIEVPNKAVPDPEHPAPTIALTAAGGAKPASSSASSTATSVAAATVSGSSGTNAESIAALILAAFAVVLALLAVWLGRPRFGGKSGNGGPQQRPLT
jgi:periplasmic copper chaperone A